MTIVDTRPVTGGVDTQLDIHVAAALDANGGVLGVESFPTTPAGYHDLHAGLAGFGQLCGIGVEGTGLYGVGLSRFLQSAGVEVLEVDRPNRQARRRDGKADPLDAIEAARAVLSGRAQVVAKGRGWPDRSHASPAGGAPLGPRRPHHVPQPDPPPRLHRPRRPCENASGPSPGAGSAPPPPGSGPAWRTTSSPSPPSSPCATWASAWC
jgi:Transposase